MESVASLTHSPVSEVLTVARRFEPVLRYTEGELFLPMPVERYVESAALYRRVSRQKAPDLVAPATKINLSTLVSYAGQGGGNDLELHFVDKPLSRRGTAAGGIARIAHGFRVEALSRWSAYSVVSSTRSCDFP